MINRLTDYQFHPASIDQPCECPLCVIHRRNARKAEQSVADLAALVEWHEQRERDLVAANERLNLESQRIRTTNGRLAIWSAARRREAGVLRLIVVGLVAVIAGLLWAGSL